MHKGKFYILPIPLLNLCTLAQGPLTISYSQLDIDPLAGRKFQVIMAMDNPIGFAYHYISVNGKVLW